MFARAFGVKKDSSKYAYTNLRNRKLPKKQKNHLKKHKIKNPHVRLELASIALPTGLPLLMLKDRDLTSNLYAAVFLRFSTIFTSKFSREMGEHWEKCFFFHQ